MADSADLVVLGAFYGSGNKGKLNEGSMADSAALVVLGAFYGSGNKG